MYHCSSADSLIDSLSALGAGVYIGSDSSDLTFFLHTRISLRSKSAEGRESGRAGKAKSEETPVGARVPFGGKANAIKFTPTGGKISIECDFDEEKVRIRVRDTGVGIPTDKITAIFEPFIQLDRRLTSTQEGTGLGLAISRDLARAMDGDLTAESTPGEGSAFTLELPRGNGEVAIASTGKPD